MCPIDIEKELRDLLSAPRASRVLGAGQLHLSQPTVPDFEAMLRDGAYRVLLPGHETDDTCYRTTRRFFCTDACAAEVRAGQVVSLSWCYRSGHSDLCRRPDFGQAGHSPAVARLAGRLQVLSRKGERIAARLIAGGDSNVVHQARWALAVGGIRPAYVFARRVSMVSRLEFEDAFMTGLLGAWRATADYESARGPFMSHASYWVRSYVMRAIDDTTHLIRLPAHLAERLARLNRALVRIWLLTDRLPDTRELASMGLDPYAICGEAALAADYGNLPEPSPFGDEWLRNILVAQEFMLPPVVADPPDPGPGPEDVAVAADVRRVVSVALEALTEREAAVIRLRFGLGGKRPETLEEVSGHFGLTRERIRQIELRAKKRLAPKLRKLGVMGTQ